LNKFLSIKQQKWGRCKEMIEEDLKNELFKIGMKRGNIYQDEIDDLLPSNFFTPEEIESLLELLCDMGVEIIYDNGNGNGSDNSIFVWDKINEDPEYERTGNLVHVYIRSMGDAPILRKDEEVELAKKLEEGREIIWEAIKTLALTKEVEENMVNNEDGKEEKEEKEENELRNLVMEATLNRLEKAIETFDSFSKKPPKRRYFSEIEKEIGMSKKELSSLWKRVCNVRAFMLAAKNELIIRNLRLVVNIAKRHVGRGLPLLDLIQEGNIGLIKAVDKFKHKKGFKFGTYATYWIKNEITRGIKDQAKTIRIPVYLLDIYPYISETIKLLIQKFRRMPTPEEIAKETNVPKWKVEKLLKMVKDPLSLHKPVFHADSETELGDTISDKLSESPYIKAWKSIRRERILGVLNTLDSKERELIKRRFAIGEGLEYFAEHTLRETARSRGINMSYNWVNENEPKILGKLRKGERGEVLKALEW
jgi:RNA polymerase primary sigma factor